MPIKILVVDDEKYILDELSEALTDEGYECLSAENVEDAITILRNNPDTALVVTDLKMPGKTGVGLIKESRAEFDRDIPFIIMSGHGDPKSEFKGFDLDEFPILRKPIDINEFLDTLEKSFSSNDNPPAAAQHP